MSWLIIPLAIQTMFGVALTFRNVSLNKWEEGESIHRHGDWLALGTGIIFVSSASWSWYAFVHDRIWCWGSSGLPLLKCCLDVIGLLLYFILFRMKSSSSSETTEED
jgi:hypothetical protein